MTADDTSAPAQPTPTKLAEREHVYAHTTDYRDREGARRGTLLNRGFWIHHLPRRSGEAEA